MKQGRKVIQVESNYAIYAVEITLDPLVEDRGEIDGIPVFQSDNGVWFPDPSYKEELYQLALTGKIELALSFVNSLLGEDE